MSTDCIFYIDVKTRDIPAMSFVGSYLREKNISVAYLPLFKSFKNGLPTVLAQSWLSPRFVISPSYNFYRSPEVAWRSYFTKSVFIEMTSEQFYSKNFIGEKIPYYGSDVTYKQDFFFVGSEYYARLLLDNANITKEEIYIVGIPKIDLAKQLNENLSNDDVSIKPTILFVSDYSLADYDQKKLNNIADAYGVNISSADVDIISQERNLAIKSAIALAKTLKYDVVFRLHPGECLDSYGSLKGSQVRVSKGDTEFLDDVQSASVVIGYTTTSVFEVVAAGKPYIYLHDFEIPNCVWREYLPLLNRASSVTLFASVEASIEFPDCKSISNDLEYFVRGISGSKMLSACAIYAALQDISQDTVSSRLKAVPVLDSIRYISQNLSAGFLRLLVKFKWFRSILFKSKSRSYHNLTHAMHNFSNQDLEKLSPKVSSKDIEVNWHLSEFGWVYKEK